MNFMKSFLLAFGALNIATASISGTEIRGGGDAVRCIASTENSLKGTYSLDYLLTKSSATSADIAPASTVGASLARIQAILERKLPKLGLSLKNYNAVIDNYTDFTRSRVWIASDSLVNIGDEDLLVTGPVNCQKSDRSGKLDLVQAVSRIQDLNTHFVRYYFDQSVVTELERAGPVQLSFLYVHEWLWDFYLPERVNNSRLVNRLLHSKQLDSLSAHDLWVSLRNLGVPETAMGDDPSKIPAPITNRNIQIAVGNWFSCASQGFRLSCWGRHPLGDSAQVIMDGSIDAIAAGEDHLCVLINSKPVCWGNAYAFSGITAFNDSKALMAVGASTCVIDKTNQLHCAGAIKERLNGSLMIKNETVFAFNNFGFCIGNAGNAECYFGAEKFHLPFQLEAVNGLTLTTTMVCASAKKGVKCFDQQDKNFMLVRPQWQNANSVAAGQNGTGRYVCAVALGKVVCDATDFQSVMRSAPDVLDAKVVAVSNTHACVLRTSGISCWGDNREGQTQVPPALRPGQ